MRKSFFSICITIGLLQAGHAQSGNFSFNPEKPRPGETITITYEPDGNLKGTMGPIEAAVYQKGGGRQKADDLALVREGRKYTASFQTDTVMDFVYLSFSANKQFDNNGNEGYRIHLYQNNEVKKGSYISEFAFYQFFGPQIGVERNNEKALAALEKEFSLFPESKKPNLVNQVRLQMAIKKDESMAIAQKAIETLLRSGLKDETDYENLAGLYNLAKLPEQVKMITALKKEKIPGGYWTRIEKMDKFYAEKDPVKKEAMLKEITGLIASNDDWKEYANSLDGLKLQAAAAYLQKKEMAKVREIASTITDKSSLASFYNSFAWEMQKKNEQLEIAEELSAFATEYAKTQWQNPVEKRPDFLTEKQWKQNNKSSYAMHADTYAMVMYKKGDYKKGFSYAKDAAITVLEGKDADLNNTYALLAEKTLAPKKIKAELEGFVKNGASTSEIKDILKRLYAKDKKNTDGFENYISTLQEEKRLELLKEIRKSMINETAPSFALYNLGGQKVDIAELKGKVVVLDFWATWCGPCKASFPGMQKVVTKYKDNPDVKFIFVDTWEQAEDKKKNAADFITSNKYSFEVLLDNENTVVEKFKVEGIPAKFVIDKNGKIVFRSVGFSGSEDKLMNEMTAMIEIASDTKKAF